MRHGLAKFRINRFTSHRRATQISLVKSLIKYESIRTTRVRAKATKALFDQLLTLAKENTLAAKRKAYAILGEHALVVRLFGELAGRFAAKPSGFTRIMNLGIRRGDSADMVVLELTELKKKEPKKAKKAKKETEPTEETNEEVIETTSEPEIKEKQQKHEEHREVKGKPPVEKKPPKNFLGGIKGIFKKERDAL